MEGFCIVPPRDDDLTKLVGTGRAGGLGVGAGRIALCKTGGGEGGDGGGGTAAGEIEADGGRTDSFTSEATCF